MAADVGSEREVKQGDSWLVGSLYTDTTHLTAPAGATASSAAVYDVSCVCMRFEFRVLYFVFCTSSSIS